MQEELAVKNLKEVKEVFDKHGIRFWLDAGTLLGAVRERRIIGWDKDMELGTMSDNWEKIISALPELKERGFDARVRKSKIRRMHWYYLSIHRFESGGPIDVDIYQSGEKAFLTSLVSTSTILRVLALLDSLLFHSEAHVQPRFKPIVNVLDRCLSLLPPKSRKSLANVVWPVLASTSKLLLLEIPKHHFERLETLEFYGITFCVPSNAEELLELRYGKDWKTPKKEWNWIRDDGAVRIIA